MKREKILLIDYNPEHRAKMKASLERMGNIVTAPTTAREALEIFGSRFSRIDFWSYEGTDNFAGLYKKLTEKWVTLRKIVYKGIIEGTPQQDKEFYNLEGAQA